MRIAFLLAILAASLFYAYGAFIDLRFLSAAGRLGPGFFPRLIGTALIATCLLSLAADFKLARSDANRSSHWVDLGMIVALSGALVLALKVLGGALATGMFLLVALSVLNRGRLLQNIVISVLLPTGVYLLFKVALNASFPDGRLPFSI